MALPSLCFFRSPLSWIFLLVLALLLVYIGFLGFELSSFLLRSIVVLILSTVYFYFTFSTQKSVQVENFVEEEEVVLSSDQRFSVSAKSEIMITENKKREKEGALPLSTTSDQDSNLDSLTESECIDHFTTSEDSEMDWPFRDRVKTSLDFSDGWISDEEAGLIEITLPSGHYVGDYDHKEEEVDDKFQYLQKISDFSSAESIFQKHSLMELLAEINDDMNEEENLIEIDISMGSIKYSGFEIEA